MSMDVKRKVELFVVNMLKANVSIPVVPFTGGGENEDSFDLEPPFVVVSVLEAERRIHGEPIYLVNGRVQVVSHLLEESARGHSELTASVVSVIEQIDSSCEPDLVIHGVDITDSKHDTDSESRAQADIISFTAGVTG